MTRVLFLLIGLALVGPGAYWRWFEPSAAGMALSTDLESVVQRVLDGEDRLPVRLERAVPGPSMAWTWAFRWWPNWNWVTSMHWTPTFAARPGSP